MNRSGSSSATPAGSGPAAGGKAAGGTALLAPPETAAPAPASPPLTATGGSDTAIAFSPTLLHELRTPIAAIRSYVEILVGCPPGDPATHRTFLQAIGEEAERLDRLIADVAELERLDGGEPFQPAPCDLAELVERAALALHPLCVRKEVELCLALPEQAPVAGEPRRLLRAVSALLENAVKFSHPGGRVAAYVQLEADGGNAVLEVDDDGIGVAPAEAERIFERYHQADVPPDAISPRGSGLGLPLARRIAARHGGSLVYAPRPAGSQFRLVLPR